MYLISEDDVIHIHDQALNPVELQGLAGDKSLSGALSRVELRLACGLIKDAFDMGATCQWLYPPGTCSTMETSERPFDVLLRARLMKAILPRGLN
ncbi:MAG: hypothetical protein OXD29_12690 [Roseovarius sp.]|nr:hypothetical protein [Roseovarius sp.]